MRRISGALLTLAVLVVGTMVVVGESSRRRSSTVMTAFGGGSDERGPETTALTVTLVRMILPAVFFLAIGVVLMGVLYALGRVTAPALSIGVRNAAIVASIVVLSGILGVKSMALGVVVGGVAIAVMQIPPLRRAGALPRPNLRLPPPGGPASTQTLRADLPRSPRQHRRRRRRSQPGLGGGAGRARGDALRHDPRTTHPRPGCRGDLPCRAAFSLSPLRGWRRDALSGDPGTGPGDGHCADRARGSWGWPRSLRPTVDLLFRHGETGDEGARLIVVALLGYLPGTLFAAYDQVLIFAFYARQNTRTPVLVGLGAIGVYFVVAFALVSTLGMLGLVLANSAQFVAHALVMYWLARRTFGEVGGHGCGGSRFPAWAQGSAWPPCAWRPGRRWRSVARWRFDVVHLGREVVLVGVPVAVGGALYVAALHWLGVDEMSLLRRAILGKVDAALGSMTLVQCTANCLPD